MWAGFVKSAARELVEHRTAEPARFLVHGDDIGSFLGWWWHTDPDTAVRFLGDYISEVHRADPLRRDDSATPINLYRKLEALPSALSIRLDRAETDAFLDRARAELAV